MALPQTRIGSPQKAQGGNKNPNAPKTRSKPPEKALETNTDSQSQVACPTSQNQPQNKHNEEKTGIENVPSVKWENGDEVRDVVTVMIRVLLAENPRTSLIDNDTQKAEEKALPVENAEEKMQE